MLALSRQPVPVSTPLRSLMLLYSVAPHDVPTARLAWMIVRIRHCDQVLPVLCQIQESGPSEVWATL